MVGLYPSEPMAEAMRGVMARLLMRLRQMEGEVRRGEDPEGIHDMRVASRRLRTALRVAEPYFATEALRPFLAALSRLGERLGAVRDLEVLRSALAQYQEQHRGKREHFDLTALNDFWLEQEGGYRAALLKHLDGRKYVRGIEKFTRFVETTNRSAKPEKLSVGYRVCEALPALIWHQYGVLRTFEPKMLHMTLDDLHQLRIAGKRFRYLLEFFREVAPADDLIETVVRVQDHLGALNDARITCGLLQIHLDTAQQAGERFHDLSGVSAYLTFQHERLGELIAGVPLVWNGMNSPVFRQRLGQVTAGI